MPKADYFHYYNFRIYLYPLVGFYQKYIPKQWTQIAISFQIVLRCFLCCLLVWLCTSVLWMVWKQFPRQQVGSGSPTERDLGTWAMRCLSSWVNIHTYQKGLLGRTHCLLIFSHVRSHWSSTCHSAMWILLCGPFPNAQVLILDFPALESREFYVSIQSKVDQDTYIISSYNAPISSTYSIPCVCLSLLGCKPLTCTFILVSRKLSDTPVDELYICQVNNLS